ncbi:hypothetical protein S40288_10265, partial [Stachybotrys chartarum IBT 40288]
MIPTCPPPLDQIEERRDTCTINHLSSHLDKVVHEKIDKECNPQENGCTTDVKIMSETQSSDAIAARPVEARSHLQTPVDGRPGDIEQRAHSMDPVNVSFSTQHALFTRLQSLLERACFEYGYKIMHDTLRERNWSCAESVQLHLWADELKHRCDTFDTVLTNSELESLFRSMIDIRNIAVERTQRLATVLKLNKYVVILETLRLEVERIIVTLQEKAEFVQLQTMKELDNVAR